MNTPEKNTNDMPVEATETGKKKKSVKKIVKRIVLSIVFTMVGLLVLLLGLGIALNIYYYADVEDNGFIFNREGKVNGVQTYRLVGLSDTLKDELTNGASEVTIPETCKGGPIVEIVDGLFRNCKGLSGVTIPTSMTSIGSQMFYGCTSLRSITIPDSVTSISDYAFYRCSGLTSITIPDSVTSISDYAFYGCSGLTSITIPDSVTSIGACAFSGCRGIASITIPDSVTSIGSETFSGCSGLTSITIPDSVTNMDDSGLFTCGNLRIIYNNSNIDFSFDAFSNLAVIVDINGNKKYKSVSWFETKDQFLFYYDKDDNDGTYWLCAYLGNEATVTLPANINGYTYKLSCWGVQNVTIPVGITSIDHDAFWGCYSLTSVVIPDSVTNIGDRAFYNCENLTSITFTGTMDQWHAIGKGSDWKYNTGSYIVHCIDGDIVK